MPLRIAKLTLDTKQYDNKMAAAENRINNLQQQTTKTIEKINFGYQQSKIMVNAVFGALSQTAAGQVGQIITSIGYTGVAIHRARVEAAMAASLGHPGIAAAIYGSAFTLGVLQAKQLADLAAAQQQKMMMERYRRDLQSQLNAFSVNR